MHKKLIVTFLLSILLTFTAQATTLEGGVELDWPSLSQNSRDSIIQELRTKLFNNIQPKVDMSPFVERKIDADRDENIVILETKSYKPQDRLVAGFYLFNKILVLYGVKYKSDKYHVYYYDMLGHLTFVDILEKPYDEYPYTSYQYDTKGKLISVIHNISDYDQYVYKANGDFYGRWYNSKCYSKKAKIIMTRKLPD